MRIISGSLGGRKFYPPGNLPTRPTTDFAKTGLFNILNNHFDFEDVSFLDLFSGTGNISYEFVSRGCPRVVSVDMTRNCVAFIKKMKEEWKMDAIEVIKSDVFRFLNHNFEKFDIVFAGPPYPLESIDQLPEKVLDGKHLKENGWFILETAPGYDFSNHPNFLQVRSYGQTRFHYFSALPKKS